MISATGVYTGKIYEKDHGESTDDLFLSDDDNSPFAERFQDDLAAHGRYVNVRYWITDEARTHDELIENQVKILVGASEADYTQHYSDVTGYLWTDAKCVVGGHDLLFELENYVGRYCYMIVDYSEEVSV